MMRGEALQEQGFLCLFGGSEPGLDMFRIYCVAAFAFGPARSGCEGLESAPGVALRKPGYLAKKSIFESAFRYGGIGSGLQDRG